MRTASQAGATASRARRLSSVKSLLSFAHQVGFTVFNVGAPVRLPPVKATLAERILPEDAVLRMLALEPDTRNRVMLRLLYGAGLRISEVASLRWRDAQPRDDAGQITVFGKGGKTRVVRLKASLWLDLIGLRRDAGLEEPVFRSRESRGEGTEFGQRRLDASQVHRIVKAAAARASLPTAVSAHWLRHRPCQPRPRSRRPGAPSAGDGRATRRWQQHRGMRTRGRATARRCIWRGDEVADDYGIYTDNQIEGGEVGPKLRLWLAQESLRQVEAHLRIQAEVMNGLFTRATCRFRLVSHNHARPRRSGVFGTA